MIIARPHVACWRCGMACEEVCNSEERLVRKDGYCVRLLSSLDVDARACAIEVVDDADILVLEDVLKWKVFHCCGFVAVDVVYSTVVVSVFLVFVDFFLSNSCP